MILTEFRREISVCQSDKYSFAVLKIHDKKRKHNVYCGTGYGNHRDAPEYFILSI